MEFRSRRAEQDDRPAHGPVGEVVDEVEQTLVGPVQVLHGQHERSRLRESLEEPTPGSKCLIASAPGAALEGQQRTQMTLDPSGLRPIGYEIANRSAELRLDRRRAVSLHDPRLSLHHLPKGPVRDSLAVWQATAAPPDDEAGLVLERALEFPDESTLADSGYPDEGDQLDRAVAPGARERVQDQAQLLLPADERGERRALVVRAQLGQRT
jgi:hypothetical protein